MSDRRNSVTIQIYDNQWDNADFLTMLYRECDNKQIVVENQPQFGDGIFFFSDGLPKDLFLYDEDFTWIPNYYGKSGNSKLYVDEKPLTIYNYRTPVYSEVEYDGEVVQEITSYIYVEYSKITDVAPVVEMDEMV